MNMMAQNFHTDAPQQNEGTSAAATAAAADAAAEERAAHWASSLDALRQRQLPHLPSGGADGAAKSFPQLSQHFALLPRPDGHAYSNGNGTTSSSCGGGGGGGHHPTFFSEHIARTNGNVSGYSSGYGSGCGSGTDDQQNSGGVHKPYGIGNFSSQSSPHQTSLLISLDGADGSRKRKGDGD